VAGVEIVPITSEQYGRLLPLIAAYQRFYGVAEPDPAHNDAFFRRFLAPSEHGLLLSAWLGDDLAGYACLYWSFSSVTPGEVVLMNDLFVAEGHRGAGIAGKLIGAAARIARERGAIALRWMTALDNRDAQRVYERTGAARSAWFEYELPPAETG
jgi:GNAT superfamily N-acetyltransferase